MYKNKKVLVAGGTGTIGISLVRLLKELKAKVTVASIDDPVYSRMVLGNGVRFVKTDLTSLKNCIKVTGGQDYVFNLVGIKGSTGIGETKVASYLVPMLWFQTNLMEASFRNSVSRYLFVSSICAYPQSDKPKTEDILWDGMPKQNDRIPGIAKRVGEIQGEAYMLEHGWDAVRIVRPSNVYGPYDDFNPATAQVIPSLIRRVLDGENPMRVWGDGSAIRDFIYSEDAAYWMLIAMEKAPPCLPINIGSGRGISIRGLTDIILSCVPDAPRVEWDESKPAGDTIRILSTERAERILGYKVITDIKEGIQKTISWYINNKSYIDQKRGYLNGK